MADIDLYNVLIPLHLTIEETARNEALSRFRTDFIGEVNKDAHIGGDNPVTKGDNAAEISLRTTLPKILPGRVLGEELASSSGAAMGHVLSGHSEFSWMVDPIDGTKAFRDGDENFGSMVSLYHGDRLIGALINYPCHGFSIGAIKGQGAFLLRGNDLDGMSYTQIHAKPRNPLIRNEDFHLWNYTAGLDEADSLSRKQRMTDIIDDSDGLLSIDDEMKRRGEFVHHPSAYVPLGLLKDHPDLKDLIPDNIPHAHGMLTNHLTLWDHAPAAVIMEELGYTVKKLDHTPLTLDDYRAGIVIAPDEASANSLIDLFEPIALQAVSIRERFIGPRNSQIAVAP